MKTKLFYFFRQNLFRKTYNPDEYHDALTPLVMEETRIFRRTIRIFYWMWHTETYLRPWGDSFESPWFNWRKTVAFLLTFDSVYYHVHPINNIDFKLLALYKCCHFSNKSPVKMMKNAFYVIFKAFRSWDI